MTKRALLYLVVVLVGISHARVALGAGKAGPAPGEKVLFTFAVFGDNKGGGKLMESALRSMRRIRPSFVLGMGDHFKSKRQIKSLESSISKVCGDVKSFYERLYITAGDNEAAAYAGKQSALGAERPFFYRVGMFDGKTDKPRRDTIVEYDRKWLDYYAQLHVAGVRVHLVSLYDQDSVKMQAETVAFADRVMPRIRKNHANEPWVVMAHDGDWWNRSFRRGHAIYSCDLLLGASWHRYAPFGAQGGGTNLAFNTSAIGRDGHSWFAVMVLADKFVLLNIADDKLAVKGTPGCHVKPFGEKGHDGDAAAWFVRLSMYGRAGDGPWGPRPTGPKTPASAPAKM